MAPTLTSNELEVPLFLEVAPVKVMVWPVWATVMVMFGLLVPLMVVVEVGVAPPSG